MTRPTLDRLDAELDRLTAAVEAIAANLVDLDNDPAKASLDKGPLTGATRDAWEAGQVALAQLWEGYATLSATLTKAKDLRAQRRLSAADEDELARLVFGPSIVLSTTTVPLAQRSLLAAGRNTTVCTPAQLLSALEQAYPVARTPVVEAGAAWSRLLAATAATATALDATRDRIRATDGDPATIDDADRRLRAFMATLATDPIGCRDADLAAVDAAIARAGAELTSAAELVASLTARLAGARRLAAELAAAETAAADAEATAAAKIAPGQFVPYGRDRELARELAEIEALAAAGQWRLLGARIGGWTDRADARLAALRSATARNTAALAERAELRGRLGAYQAKAARTGRAEDGALAELATAAKSLLYTAPCDLVAARAAVDAFQAAVAGQPASAKDGTP